MSSETPPSDWRLKSRASAAASLLLLLLLVLPLALAQLGPPGTPSSSSDSRNGTQRGARPAKSSARTGWSVAAAQPRPSAGRPGGANLTRPPAQLLRRPQEFADVGGQQLAQVSITPRVSLVRVPVENNAILKCLISWQAPPKFKQRLTFHWARFLWDENLYEQIEAPAESQDSDNQQQQQQRMRDFLSRSRQETNVVSELLLEATLAISSVKPADNATYFCTASDGRADLSEARIDLVALHRPSVRLDRLVPARDSKSALVHWSVLADGNTPIKKTLLMVRNDSVIRQPTPSRLAPGLLPSESGGAAELELASIAVDSERHQWQRVEIANDGESTPALAPPTERPESAGDESVVRADVDVTSIGAAHPQQVANGSDWRHQQRRPRQRSHNLTNLLPGVTYNLRLAAINDMGQSEWSYLTASMPNEIPAQISEVFLLSRSNDSLAIGWRRPAYDTAKTVRYELQLLDLNRTLTLDAHTNNTSAGSHQRTNFMYVFVNLHPGTDYHFQVRACSRAGCSAFSEPRLPASTMDGEPDEPLDVELLCHPDSGNVSISWLPPVNPRGQLLNYSVSLHSRANYQNQSGAWLADEWRTTMETGDNHTLVLEASGLLLPNTNYTARVCANNRSKHCGRLNPPTTRGQCSTPPELPGELPAGLRLSLQSVADGDPADQTKSLLLELPFISRRNGTLSCVQIILVRLPKTFTNSSSLADFLPEDPKDLPLSKPSDLLADGDDDSPADRSGGSQRREERPVALLADQMDPSRSLPAPNQEYQIVLGDGLEHSSCDALASLGEDEYAKSRPFDGSLRPHTYYSAYVKLMLLRPRYRSQAAKFDSSRRRHTPTEANSHVELLTKYSHYLAPVRTGEFVPSVSWPGEESAAVRLANYLNVSLPAGVARFATELSDSVSSQFNKFYRATSGYLRQNVRLESLSKFIAQSSPLMQLLEIGIIMFLVLLLLIFVIYLTTLPAKVSHRKKLKLKRKLQQHEVSVAAAASAKQEEAESGFDPQLNGLAASGYQQPQPECPTDSYSPQVAPSDSDNQLNGRRPSLHACPPQEQPREHQLYHHQPLYAPQSAYESMPRASHYHAHQHGHQAAPQVEHFDPRECKTLRRVARQGEPADGAYAGNLTLSRHHNSLLALAKKINKSIPLRLFHQVHELRLRNGWLRDEYESLPRAQISAEMLAAQTEHQPSAPVKVAGPQVKLRPQLIVSRNDSVSALISGNERYDASVLKLHPGAPNQAGERRIICARSPLDANSVWDFWRMVYEQEVSTIVMLTQNEDPSTGETRCAHYWPTHDNEETTILSPRNELVLASDIPPAKFKIRLETLEAESSQDNYQVRRLTLLVMGTRPGENAQTPDERQDPELSEPEPEPKFPARSSSAQSIDEDELVIVERDVTQIQFFHWNTSTAANQARLVRFVELVHEKHARNAQLESPGATNLAPVLVHCINGLGRSGVFAAMSFVLDELRPKLRLLREIQQQQQPVEGVAEPKINLFHLVSRLRQQRELVVSPCRFYELLYQLTSNCIPSGRHQRPQ